MRRIERSWLFFRRFALSGPPRTKRREWPALPYDVVSREEARIIGEKNPDSFLHVDRAEMDLPADTDLYDSSVYEKARENLQNMEKKGILVQDEKPCYYIYELTRKGKTQTGIVGCSSIDDYISGVVKKHELTREDKEQDRIRHVDVCDANTGPDLSCLQIYADTSGSDRRMERKSCAGL